MRSVRLCFVIPWIAVGACADQPIVAPSVPSALANVTSETSTDMWRSVITGKTGPGSFYSIAVPRSWDGEVVFYAHGIRDVLTAVELRDQDAFYAVRDQLGARGFAIAYSSFSENGFAIEDAAQRMHQLRGLFTSRFGKPTRSYLVGHSLGALAIMQLADRYPDQYDGALPVCGIMGGTTAQLEYVVNVRALFDYFYPGMLPGSAAAPVPGYVISGAKQLEIAGAVLSKPLGLAVIASTAQTPLEFTNGSQLVQSLVTALSWHARGADNVLTFTNGKFPVSNIGVTYSKRQGPVVPPLASENELLDTLAVVNAKIARFGADRAGALWAAKNYTPAGNLRMPILTLHNKWDPLVPYFNEGLLLDRVIKAGSTNLLLQRAENSWGYGHCNIPPETQKQAVVDLVEWVKTGVKP